MPTRYTPGYTPGGTYVICDICGFKNRASNTAMMYNNLRACKDTCWDRRPPNDTPPKVIPGEGKAIKNPRPESTDVFIDSTLSPDPESLS